MIVENLREWGALVLERDGYICTECGVTGCRLHAHHIKEKKLYPDLQLDLDNGKTLCINCHTKYHPYMTNFYGVNPDISNEFIGVYKGGKVVKVDIERYNTLVFRAAKELLAMFKRRERKKGIYKHGRCIGNWWMKKHGYRKDIRADVWFLLEESGLILKHKESVWLFATLAKASKIKRCKIAPAFIIKAFKNRAKEHYEFLHEVSSGKKRLNDLTKSSYKEYIDYKNFIMHPLFGEGEVLKKWDGKVTIKFNDGQTKIFNLSKLEELGAKETTKTILVGTDKMLNSEEA